MKKLFSFVLFTLFSCSLNAQSIDDFKGSFQSMGGSSQPDSFDYLLILNDTTFELVGVAGLYPGDHKTWRSITDLLAAGSKDITVVSREKGSWHFNHFEQGHQFTAKEMYHGLNGTLIFSNGRSQYFTEGYLNDSPYSTIMFMNEDPRGDNGPGLSYMFMKCVGTKHYTN